MSLFMHGAISFELGLEAWQCQRRTRGQPASERAERDANDEDAQ